MMVQWEGPHPDEGSIHAWLDDALDAPEAGRLEAHVRTCVDCTARVAEARGLIAGASRVVGLLDETPAPLIRPAVTSTASGGNTVWRMLRVTPARASIAAVLLVGLGITLTRSRVAMESVVPSSDTSASHLSKDAVTASAPMASPAPMKDKLLDSAIARRVASEHPTRKLEPAPGATLSVPSANDMAAPVPPDPTAAGRVAAGKASIQAQRDSFGAPSDKARVGFKVAAPVTAERLAVAGRAAEDAAGRNYLSAKAGGVLFTPFPTGQCYRVESPTPGAQWGSATLPIIVAFDTSGFNVRVLTATGGETDTRASVGRAGQDSLVLRLRRIGYSGSLALAGTGDTRGGVMRSAPLTAQLSEVVTTGTGEAREAKSVDSAREKRAIVPSRAAQTPAAAAPSIQMRGARTVEQLPPTVPVTAHVVSCPKP